MFSNKNKTWSYKNTTSETVFWMKDDWPKFNKKIKKS